MVVLSLVTDSQMFTISTVSYILFPVTDRSDVYNNTVWLYCLLLLIGQMLTINTV